MSDKLQQCHLIGAGRAGSALAQAMTKVGYQFTWVGSRNAESAEKLAKLIGTEEWWTDFRDIQEVDGFLIIAIPDDKIKMVAATIRDAGVIKPGRTVIAHLSGALGSNVLESLRGAGASGMAFHPCQTLTPESDSDKVFRGICFDMEGDAAACEIGARVAIDLGAVSVVLSPEQRALTHLAMTTASNYSVSLIHMAETILATAGCAPEISKRMLEPLVFNAVCNSFEIGTENALTGPVSRGDNEIIKQHLKLLESIDAKLLSAYKALAQIAMEIAVRRGSITTERADEMKKLFT